MARPRTIPDTVIYDAILRLIAEGGEKAVAFSSVAEATHLAAPSLVQRYGSLPQMVNAALSSAWDDMDAVALNAIAGAQGSKGPQSLLKALSPAPSPAVLAASLRHATLRDRATAWRDRVTGGLTSLVGDADIAAILFAAWAGQSQWDGFGDKAFKIKDLIKRLS